MSGGIGFDPTTYISAVQQAKSAASAAYHAAMQPPEAPRALIKSCWEELIRRNHVALATGGPDGQLAAAHEATAVMTAIMQLAPQHYRALAEPEHRRASGAAINFAEEAESVAAAIASNPVLAKFQAERDQASQERAAEAEANRQAIEAQRLRDLPRNLLDELHRRGVVLKLTGNSNHIAAIPAHLALMQQSEIDAIKERRADFLALLRAEALALVPVVIA